jgi:hypothetical protein
MVRTGDHRGGCRRAGGVSHPSGNGQRSRSLECSSVRGATLALVADDGRPLRPK